MVSLAKGYDAEEGDYYKLYPSVSTVMVYSQDQVCKDGQFRVKIKICIRGPWEPTIPLTLSSGFD